YDFAQAGFLAPLQDQIAATPDYNYEDFAAPLPAINEVAGPTYGVPFYNYVLGLIYRTDLLEAAGLPVPTTMDELVTTAQALTTEARAGIAMQPQRGYKVFEEWGNWLFAAGGSIYDEAGMPSLDTPEAKAALDAYIKTYETAAPKDSLNWGFDEALRSVSSDQAAMMVSYNWMLPTLNKVGGSAGDLAGKYALAPMPGGKGVLGEWSWSIPTNSASPDAAWAFISWLTSPEVEKTRVIAGGAPVRLAPLSDPEVAEKGFGADYYSAVAAMLANSAPLSQGPSGEEMIQVVGTELNSAVAGQKEVADALAEAQKQAAAVQGL
ncbi:MAG: sugar ABC transporter substrate-binding protein, partial [Actinobacteria bacterium]|nr:sugar ABC transporter substrate-binding protein [Actinomycetota bacterium]